MIDILPMGSTRVEKMTSSQANKLLKALEEELAGLLSVESMSKNYTLSVDEDASNKPDYNFASTQERINNIQLDIMYVKHSINVFNTTTTFPCGLTIDELLVRMPQLNKNKEKLYRMSTMLPKTRVSSYSSSGVEYNYANYSIDDAKKCHKAFSDAVANAQKELDTINNTVEFDVIRYNY